MKPLSERIREDAEEMMELKDRLMAHEGQAINFGDMDGASLIRDARERIALLESSLAEVKETTKRIMAEECPTDEIHCTCVPYLRIELAEARQENERLQEALKEADYCTCNMEYYGTGARDEVYCPKHDALKAGDNKGYQT